MMGQVLEDYKDTEMDDLISLIFKSQEQSESLEQIYQYSKMMHLNNDIEVDIFVDPPRKQ